MPIRARSRAAFVCLLGVAVLLCAQASLGAQANKPRRIRVSRLAQEQKLIYAPDPAYPERARQARIRGAVRLEVLIRTDGAVKQIRPTSGHPLLIGAAIEAVKKWRYRPTLLNGEPVEVLTTVEVRFPPRQPEAGQIPVKWI